MRPSTAVLAAVTLMVGIGGGAVAYELASTVAGPSGATGGTGATEITAVIDEEPPTTVPGTRFGWAPCQAPAVLRGDTCVTRVVHTVVLPGTTAAASTATGGVAVAPAYQDDDGDEGYEDEGHDDDHDDESDDAGDDGDDDGDDDHDEDD